MECKHPHKRVRGQDSECAATQAVAHGEPANLFEVSNCLVNSDVSIQQCVQRQPAADVSSFQAKLSNLAAFDKALQGWLECFFCTCVNVRVVLQVTLFHDDKLSPFVTCRHDRGILVP